MTTRLIRDFVEIFNIYFSLFWGGGQNNQKGRWGKVLSSSLSLSFLRVCRAFWKSSKFCVKESPAWSTEASPDDCAPEPHTRSSKLSWTLMMARYVSYVSVCRSLLPLVLGLFWHMHTSWTLMMAQRRKIRCICDIVTSGPLADKGLLGSPYSQHGIL